MSDLQKYDHQHKYDHGHALVLSGGPGRTGAARLAARAALRVGAGLVTLGVPPAAQMEAAAQVTAIMLARVDGPDGLVAVLEDARINALCLGPALGLERAREFVPIALRGVGGSRRPVVLDADALSGFASAPGDLFAHLHRGAVLTPHQGEFARLFPDLAQAVADKLITRQEATLSAASRARATVLLKGAETIVAAPDGAVRALDASAPWLATAGSGDVLSGLICGLLARGFAPFEAAVTGAELHSEAGRHVGPGLIAEDLPEAIPAVLRARL